MSPVVYSRPKIENLRMVIDAVNRPGGVFLETDVKCDLPLVSPCSSLAIF